MSVATTAKPLSRRMLERSGMTPEQELELLIAEQAADDTYVISRHGEISLDAPAPNGEGALADLIGVDEDGYIIDFIPPSISGLADPSRIPHGTRGGYTKHKCKCVPCTRANREYIASYRAARKADQ